MLTGTRSPIRIGAPDAGQWNGPYYGRGSAYVVFGSRELMKQKMVNLSNLNGTNGFKVSNFVKNSYTGSNVGSGDVNGDGIADVMISCGLSP